MAGLMVVYVTKDFARFARKAKLSDERLLVAALEVESGQWDADLGGGVFKQRVAREGGGKSGGFRTIIVFRRGHRSVFVHGFAKSDKATITMSELRAFKRLAESLLNLSNKMIDAVTSAGELREIVANDEKIR